jgi:hypothetical protein
MDIWLRDLSEITHVLLGGPASTVEYVGLLVAVILVLLLAMYVVGSAMRLPNLGTFRRLFALSVGVGFSLCVWVAVLTYLLPHVEMPLLRSAVMYGVPALACLAVVIPIQ